MNNLQNELATKILKYALSDRAIWPPVKRIELRRVCKKWHNIMLDLYSLSIVVRNRIGTFSPFLDICFSYTPKTDATRSSQNSDDGNSPPPAKGTSLTAFSSSAHNHYSIVTFVDHIHITNVHHITHAASLNTAFTRAGVEASLHLQLGDMGSASLDDLHNFVRSLTMSSFSVQYPALKLVDLSIGDVHYSAKTAKALRRYSLYFLRENDSLDSIKLELGSFTVVSSISPQFISPATSAIIRLEEDLHSMASLRRAMRAFRTGSGSARGSRLLASVFFVQPTFQHEMLDFVDDDDGPQVAAINARASRKKKTCVQAGGISAAKQRRSLPPELGGDGAGSASPKKQKQSSDPDDDPSSDDSSDASNSDSPHGTGKSLGKKISVDVLALSLLPHSFPSLFSLDLSLGQVILDLRPLSNLSSLRVLSLSFGGRAKPDVKEVMAQAGVQNEAELVPDLLERVRDFSVTVGGGGRPNAFLERVLRMGGNAEKLVYKVSSYEPAGAIPILVEILDEEKPRVYQQLEELRLNAHQITDNAFCQLMKALSKCSRLRKLEIFVNQCVQDDQTGRNARTAFRRLSPSLEQLRVGGVFTVFDMVEMEAPAHAQIENMAPHFLARVALFNRSILELVGDFRENCALRDATVFVKSPYLNECEEFVYEVEECNPLMYECFEVQGIHVEPLYLVGDGAFYADVRYRKVAPNGEGRLRVVFCSDVEKSFVQERF